MNMTRKILFLVVAALASTFACAGEAARSLWDDFSNPPDSAKPWCYYFWQNGLADRETITADLEAMKRLGFGGILMVDTRGYWDDADHVVIPKAELAWGSPEWYDLVEFCIRECDRLGIEFTMNAAASGGTMQSFVDGKPYEADVMDRNDIIAHLERVLNPLLKRVPELVGKTFTHIYSVSYEGSVKTGGSWSAIKDTFYATMCEWAHAHGLKVYSESGGPWFGGAQSAKLDCDQLDLLAHNDFPQGEFWPQVEKFRSSRVGHANRNGRFFSRAIVLSARREGRSIASMEAFTHMHRHWSVDPAFLKPLADIAYADGMNRLVWHTFTSSPKKFGIPGSEYFAGSHINRNVTWHKDADAFVKYLWRCQAPLQRGEYVDDGEFVSIKTNYYSWGRYRKDDNAQFTTAHRREGSVDWFFVAGEGKGDVVLNASSEGRTVEVWDPVAVRAARPLAAAATADGKTRVTLDLPVGGSCFVVFLPKGTGDISRVEHVERVEVGIANPWLVSFAYMDGVSAAPPEPVVMETLRDWTFFGEHGKAGSKELRYFAGTATYRSTFSYSRDSATPQSHNPTIFLSLGELKSGVAHVFVNGKDCGVVWCAPWEADISSAVRDGENEIEIRYTNNWYNRLVGDCFLEPGDRVTRSTLRYWDVPRTRDEARPWKTKPTVYSGPSVADPLQPSGLLGPVKVVVSGTPSVKSALSANLWAVNSTRFMYPPRIAFPRLRGAADAVCEVEGADGAKRTVAAPDGIADLAPVWDALPVGYVHLTAKSEKGEDKRFFWKKAMFRDGAYGKALCGYGESAAKCYRYLMDMPAMRYLVEKGEPDPAYELNCYPNKMCAAVIRGFTRHAAKNPGDAERSLAIARAAADWLISVSEPDGAPLAGFPPTYMGDKLSAKSYAGQVMTSYPCGAASAYIALGKSTGDGRYLDAAKRIAATYLKLQGEDGTWPLKVYAKDGKDVCPNRLMPVGVIEMFEALFAETGDARYRAAADRAFGYLERGPMSDWNWEGQFEDVRPSGKYHNLTKHDVCSSAIYALGRFPGDARWIAFAKDAERFAEDQFVDWEVPYGKDDPAVWGPFGRSKWQMQFSSWRCPAVMEQYECYVPVDASAAKLVRTWIALYKATGDELYLRKAKALGDQATAVQREDGSLPTWWKPDSPRHRDWLNCMIAMADALEELQDAAGR